MSNHLEATFDPYHVWLGIPPAEQPPNYYRLLGIARFEENLEVIESAADRQMAHVRSFQNGSRAKESQRLLNQIASARVCLLGATAKQKYDESLRRESSPAIGIDEAPVVSAAAPNRKCKLHSHKRRLSADVGWKPIAAGLAFAALLGTGCILFALSLNPTANEPNAPITPNESKQAEVAAHRAPQLPLGPEQPETVTEASGNQDQDAGARVEPIDEPNGFADLAAEFDALASLPQQETAREGDLFPANIAQPPSDPKSSRKSAKSSQWPVPTAEQLREAEVTLTSENSNLLKIDGRKRSGKELLDLAKSANVSPAICFRLLEIAADRAAEEKNIELALLAVDEASERFHIDAWQRRFDVLSLLNQGLVPSAMLNGLLTGSQGLIAEALAIGRFDRASKAGQLAAKIADHPHAGHLRANAKTLSNFTRNLESQHQGYLAAMSSLEADSGDSTAHATIGRWLCFVVDDWQRGLPHFTQGIDYNLAQAAKLDLAATSDSVDCAQAGDVWWKLAEGRSELECAAMKRRALHWYEIASTRSENSLTDVRIGKRIREARRLNRPLSIGNDAQKEAQAASWRNLPN